MSGIMYKNASHYKENKSLQDKSDPSASHLGAVLAVRTFSFFLKTTEHSDLKTKKKE